MPYAYPGNIPTFAKNKKAALQRRVIDLFNTEFNRTNDETAARRAALAFMSNYEKKYGDQTDKRIKKSTEDQVVELLKSKYSPDTQESNIQESTQDKQEKDKA